MSTFLYRLDFRGPFHFGLHGIGLEEVQERLASDSLTSAVVNAFAVVEGQEGASELVKALLSPNPPFVLSSLYPFGPDPEDPSSATEVLPRPLTNPPLTDPRILQKYGKDLKRIRYLGLEDFRAWIGQKELGEEQVDKMVRRSKEITKDWWFEELRPRVAIDRVSNNSSIWNQSAIWFRKEERSQEGRITKARAGLYGLVRFREEKWEERISYAFQMLGEMGLGGERTYGLGSFRFNGFAPLRGAWNDLFSNQSRSHVFLSVYYPSDAERVEIRTNLEAWEIIERRGYVVTGRNTTTVKRKRIRMIIEGSVARKPLNGAMVDVTPEGASGLGIPHRVYRSGLAFLVPGGSL